MRDKFHFGGHIVLALVAVAGFSAVVMLLWNWLIPTIFGLTAISFWQALGLLAFARILFGGMGSGRFWGTGMMKHHHNPIRKKWMQMTPDERKEFVKNHHWGRRGFEHHPGHDFFSEDKPEKQD